MERRLGVPKTDIERIMSHYGVSEAEACAHPEDYPLPPRGTQLAGMGLGTLAVIMLIIWAVTRKR